jgi:hypothetical protein
MRFSKRHIEMASVILASTLALGQQPQINGREIDGPSSLLVRLSFTSTWVADVGDKDFPQICFSVDRSGRYQIGARHESWKSCSPRLPVVFKAAVELAAAQGDDGVGAAYCPKHA